jgi:hypothetical protein
VEKVADAHDVRLSYSAVAQIELLPAPTEDAEPTVKVLRFGADPDDPGGPDLLQIEDGPAPDTTAAHLVASSFSPVIPLADAGP